MSRYGTSKDSVNQLRLPNLAKPYHNQGLFADHFLADRVLRLPEWQSAANIQDALQAIWKLYNERTVKFTARTNEAQTEHNFIQPVLDILWRENQGGGCYQVQSGISTLDAHRRPDYAFFCTAKERDDSEKQLGTLEYWLDVPVLGDAKRWSASLDKERGVDDNPSAQICRYLYRSRVRWGILTNGRIWRLYEREKSSPGGIFYEIDLHEILQQGNIESFKYFYLFFRREAFLPDQTGVTFVDKVFQGSVDYAAEVGDRLKESVYDALGCLMNGFLAYPANGLDISDPDTIKMVHDNCLIILYRLLFILYAEDRRLLPCEDEYYATYSLRKLYQEINQNLRAHHPYLSNATMLWGCLCSLFALIDEGFKNGNRIIIPAYNGGLFDPSNYLHIAHTPQFDVKRWGIGDQYLAQAIDLLAYERERWDEVGTRDVDYATMDVQHLGSIYEGLLELQPRVAEEPMIETLKDGRPSFKPQRNVPDPRPIRGQPPRTVGKGKVYLSTDRGERKATGSYYTPKYIVQYIVENTVGPLADEAAKQVAEMRPEVDKEIADLRRKRSEWEKSSASSAQKHVADLTRLIEDQKRRLLEPYLSLRILDPAMGSGHFLVGAADFLSLAMATDPNLLPLDEMDEGDPQAFCKRLAVERCLYGVDLNPLAVELAKLSLWLHTVSKDKALSFLDHHLRCGNSLIGARIEDDLSSVPPEIDSRGRVKQRKTDEQPILGFTETLMATHLQHFLDTFCRIVETPTGDAEIERMKDRWYREMDAARNRFRAVANCWLAPYFGVPVTLSQYQRAVKALRNDAEYQAFVEEKWFRDVQAVARQKRFFHWELEFPEAFFDAHGLKPEEKRGFDVVVGNPPYGAGFSDYDKRYMTMIFHTVAWRGESYIAFVEKSIELIRASGLTSMIIPDTWMSLKFTEPARKLMLEATWLRNAVALPRTVFPDATVDTAIYVAQKKPIEKVIKKYTEVVVYRKDISIGEIKHRPNYICDQLDWLKNLNSVINIHASPEETRLCRKIQSSSDLLSEITEIKYGLKAYQEGKGNPPQTRQLVNGKPFTSSHKVSPEFAPFLEGQEISRYSNAWDCNNWIHWGQWLAEPRNRELFNGERLLFRKVAGVSLIGTVISQEAFSNTLLYVIKVTKPRYAIRYLLAVLNSRLMGFCFRKAYDINPDDSFPQILLDDMAHLPIHSVDFTIASDDRARLFEEGQAILDTLSAGGKSDTVLEFVEYQLHKTPERADVIHDLLAFLAEQMVDMNNQKQEEISGFLKWLERYLCASVEDLKNKTKLRSYHDYDFQTLLDVLRQNRRTLKVDADSRNVQETVEREFNASMSKLNPLKSKIADTDRLIDLIVYRLYGLTEEEIEIVEETMRY